MIVSGIYFVVRRIRLKRSHKAENSIDQDTTKSTTSSNEKDPLISTATRTKGSDNSYSAAANTEPEFTGQTQRNATGRTQTEYAGQAQSNGVTSTRV